MADYSKLLDRLELAPDLSPETRAYNYKGRIRQAFKAVSSKMGTSIAINFMLIIFAAPIIALFIIYLPSHIQGLINAAGLNFTSGIGIDFGVIDDTVQGIEILYNTSLKFILYYFTPSMLLLGLGMSGAFYCCRNLLWGTKCKVFIHFFRGIGKNWWKFLITFGYLGLLGTSLGSGLCILLRDMAIKGSCNAGIWVWVIFSCILALFSVVFCLFAMPTFVQYNLSFKGVIKNTLHIAPLLIVPTIFVLIGLSIPLLLSLIGFIKIFIYILFVALGLTYYVMFFLAFGQYANDSFVRSLYDLKMRNDQREQEKERKKTNQQKSKAQKNIKQSPSYSKKKKK